MARLTEFARVITFDRRGSGLSDPLLRRADARGADGRRARRDGRGGLRAGRDLRHARGRPDGRAVRRHPSRSAPARWSSTPPSRGPPGRPTTTGPGPPRSATPTWTSCSSTGARAGWPARSRRASRTTPSFMEWAGRLERLAASPATIRRIFDLIGELRRARRAAVDPRADAGDAPDARTASSRSSTRATSPSTSRARATWSSRAATTCSRSATRRRCSARSRSSSPARGTSASPTACSPRCCSRTSWDSTERAAEMGDRGWRFLLERHDALFRQAIERHRGREVKRTGDGFLATFDGPARAIRCAASIAEAMGSLGHRGPRRPAHGRARGDGRRRRRPRRAHRRRG